MGVSGLTSLINAKNAINTQTALLRDQQSGKNQIVNIGSEYDRLNYLDNP